MSTTPFSDEYEYIIVGQGIAGTVLAHAFLERKKNILVIDDPNYSSSSKVAPGLFNPVVFKRLTKSWMIDELLPASENFYTQLEHTLGEIFFYKKELAKLFSNEEEKIFWKKKSEEGSLQHYLSNKIEEVFCPDIIHNNCGAAFVKKAGYIDVKKMLAFSQEYLQKKNLYLQDRFNFSLLQINSKNVNYKNIRANKIIFCEGFRATENPFFDWLKFKLTKGEVLTIQLREEDSKKIPDKVINKGVFILPIGNNLYRVGATHSWDNLSEAPTAEGKNELLEKLNHVLKIPYTIIAHEAGVRPAVHDRRPLIGLHPSHNTLGIFNGLGTKGVMLAPYFANHFADVLEGKKLLNKEVDILRFWK
ncbi:MAG: FAD-binding oxidoreductase [Bacteroidia bacterium]|nr:FAD-binding oxidoreductase [Bacteroidia bacterium]